MKKIFSFALGCLWMIFAMATVNASFDDVVSDHKNASAIDFLQQAGVISGYSDGTFKPGVQINRAELMKILVEAQGVVPDPEVYNNCFSDVKDEWFAPYVCYAKSVEWVEGYPNGTFRPEQPINKVEAIKMTVNSQGFDVKNVVCGDDLFPDVNKNEWYGKYLCMALEKGLLEESRGKNYVPSDEVTRAQVSENIFRAIALKELKVKAFREELKSSFKDALAAFKAEKIAIKGEIDLFKDELKVLKASGEFTDESLGEALKDFWKKIEESNKQQKKLLKAQVKETRELFKQKRDLDRKIYKDCLEKKEIDSALECKPIEFDDDDDDDGEDNDDDSADDDSDDDSDDSDDSAADDDDSADDSDDDSADDADDSDDDSADDADDSDDDSADDADDSDDDSADDADDSDDDN